MALRLTEGSPGAGMSFEAPFGLDWARFGKLPFFSPDGAEKSIHILEWSIQRHDARDEREPHLRPKCGSWRVGAGL